MGILSPHTLQIQVGNMLPPSQSLGTTKPPHCVPSCRLWDMNFSLRPSAMLATGNSRPQLSHIQTIIHPVS